MSTTTVAALEAALPELGISGKVFHAYHDDDGYGDVNRLYADLDVAKQHSAALYAYEEYGDAPIPDGALAWQEGHSWWELFDQGSNTGITVMERRIWGAKAVTS